MDIYILELLLNWFFRAFTDFGGKLFLSIFSCHFIVATYIGIIPLIVV